MNIFIGRYYPNRLRGSAARRRRRVPDVGLRYDRPGVLRYEKSLGKCRSRPAITDGVGLREMLIKRGS